MNHILLVRCNVVAVLTMTITFVLDRQQRNFVQVFHNFKQYTAYMWRIEEGNSVFCRNLVYIYLITWCQFSEEGIL
jgi:hypothetical protein